MHLNLACGLALGLQAITGEHQYLRSIGGVTLTALSVFSLAVPNNGAVVSLEKEKRQIPPAVTTLVTDINTLQGAITSSVNDISMSRVPPRAHVQRFSSKY